jgi:hypothetical protein
MIKEILAVMIAIGLFEILMRYYDYYKNRKLDLGCNYCEEAKKTNPTPDNEYRLCADCMKIYVEKHKKTLKNKLRDRKKKVTTNEV